MDWIGVPGWPLEASREDREAGFALPVSSVPDRTGPLEGFESASYDGGSPQAADASSPEVAETPEEQGPLSAAPSTSVGIATEDLLHPADATTTSTTSYIGAPQGHPTGELRARFEAAYPGRHDAIVGWPSVSQKRKAPPPKAPPGYEGPAKASPPVRALPGTVPNVAAETPGPRLLSDVPITSVSTVPAGIMFPLATGATGDLSPTFLIEEPDFITAERLASQKAVESSQMDVDTERASQEGAPAAGFRLARSSPSLTPSGHGSTSPSRLNPTQKTNNPLKSAQRLSRKSSKVTKRSQRAFTSSYWAVPQAPGSKQPASIYMPRLRPTAQP